MLPAAAATSVSSAATPVSPVGVAGFLGMCIAVILWWIAVRLVDIVVRGQLLTAFAFDWHGLVFWTEIALIGGAGMALRRKDVAENGSHLFLASLTMVIGGMVYRYAPPFLAFSSKPLSFYSPTVIEILISVGFIALCHMGFLLAVKQLPILPAPVAEWDDLVDYYRHLYPWIQMTRSDHATSEHRPSYAD